MAHHKSALKRVRQTIKRTAQNVLSEQICAQSSKIPTDSGWRKYGSGT